MKTRMKKLISISTIPVLALALLLVLGTVMADNGAKPAKKPAPSLTGTIEVVSVGHLGIYDDEGRLLCWDGEIQGDIEGVILWWIDTDCSEITGKVSHYVARWEIFDDEADPETDPPLLAGEDAGTTTTPPGKDGIWRGHGIVTEASAEFEDWIGRHVYESGTVYWDTSPISGDGIFSIN